MPEGDTIFRTAETLNRALGGKPVVRFASCVPGIGPGDEQEIRGAFVRNVEARGKNLLIHFSRPLTLHTHLRMRGSWHVYRPGEKWQKSRKTARVVIEVADFVAVCFSAPIVRLLRAAELRMDERLRRLGPDPLKQAELNIQEIVRAMKDRPDFLIGDALLSQRIMAGIGNVYKSETLFVESVNPFKKVGDLDDAILERLIQTAASLLRRNVGTGPRRTRFSLRGPLLWVYGRSGKSCLRCGAKIKAVQHGKDFRFTFYCPICQKAGG